MMVENAVPSVPAERQAALREGRRVVSTHRQAVGAVHAIEDDKRIPGGHPARSAPLPCGVPLMANPVTQQYKLLHLGLAGSDHLVELMTKSKSGQSGGGLLIGERSRRRQCFAHWRCA